MNNKSNKLEDLIISKIKETARVQDIVNEIAGEDPKRKIAVIKKILEMESKGIIQIVEKLPHRAESLSSYPPEIANLEKSLNRLIKIVESGGIKLRE